ncbi:MAG: hypothetical protein HBSAPP03_02870 [Phycisphaerae bacterium]|nr:MAG: hypothetical protein HBSAPP03_02870 [Phycisphaerae bacterium]
MEYLHPAGGVVGGRHSPRAKPRDERRSPANRVFDSAKPVKQQFEADMVAQGRIRRFETVPYRGASDRPAKAGRFCFTHRAVSGRPGVLAAGRAKSRQNWGLRRPIGIRPARPRSRFGPAHRAGDENPVGSGRPPGQTSQTLSDSRLTPPPI